MAVYKKIYTVEERNFGGLLTRSEVARHFAKLIFNVVLPLLQGLRTRKEDVALLINFSCVTCCNNVINIYANVAFNQTWTQKKIERRIVRAISYGFEIQEAELYLNSRCHGKLIHSLRGGRICYCF
jgi:hypothetical protein